MGQFDSNISVADAGMGRDFSGGGGAFGALVDPRTYGALFYMLLSLGLGIFYFTWAITGLALSVGLFILIIGIPFALAFVGSVRIIGWVEARIVSALLGADLPLSTSSHDEGLTFWGRIKAGLTDPHTWGTLFYMILMLPLGIVYFVMAVVGFVVPCAFIAEGSYHLYTGQSIGERWGGHSGSQIDEWPQIEAFLNTTPGLITMVVVGVIGLFLMLNIARGVGYLHARIAEGLLVR